MSTRVRSIRTVVAGAALMTLGGGPEVAAHVGLNEPGSGERFDSGSVVTVEWVVTEGHDTENWDLWYSTSSEQGPWIEIATDLPAGDVSTGAVHQYDWTVPDLEDETVWVRVRQDNLGEDYYDISESPFAVRPFVLEITPTTVTSGQPLTLEHKASTRPGALTVLILVEVNQVATFFPILFPVLDAQGRWSLQAGAPDEPGYDTTFIALTTAAQGGLLWSNSEELRFR